MPVNSAAGNPLATAVPGHPSPSACAASLSAPPDQRSLISFLGDVRLGMTQDPLHDFHIGAQPPVEAMPRRSRASRTTARRWPLTDEIARQASLSHIHALPVTQRYPSFGFCMDARYSSRISTGSGHLSIRGLHDNKEASPTPCTFAHYLVAAASWKFCRIAARNWCASGGTGVLPDKMSRKPGLRAPYTALIACSST